MDVYNDDICLINNVILCVTTSYILVSTKVVCSPTYMYMVLEKASVFVGLCVW
jgi:hypothetical protein